MNFQMTAYNVIFSNKSNIVNVRFVIHLKKKFYKIDIFRQLHLALFFKQLSVNQQNTVIFLIKVVFFEQTKAGRN